MQECWLWMEGGVYCNARALIMNGGGVYCNARVLIMNGGGVYLVTRVLPFFGLYERGRQMEGKESAVYSRQYSHLTNSSIINARVADYESTPGLLSHSLVCMKGEAEGVRSLLYSRQCSHLTNSYHQHQGCWATLWFVWKGQTEGVRSLLYSRQCSHLTNSSVINTRVVEPFFGLYERGRQRG